MRALACIPDSLPCIGHWGHFRGKPEGEAVCVCVDGVIIPFSKVIDYFFALLFTLFSVNIMCKLEGIYFLYCLN